MNMTMKRAAAILIALVMAMCMMPQCAAAGEKADSGGEDEVATVRVYFSISDDSEFLTGNDADGRVMARVPIDVPYVDLAEYGLESYYRYEAKSFEEGGTYKMPFVIVERPTLLMCYLKALSQYYLGREITASDISFNGNTKAMTVSGAATSLYFLWLWGHFYNFMYFVNHQYPLMSKGWGSTADYILLEDGDEIDVGMFSDTRFYQYGGFAYFDTGNETVTSGDSLELTLYLTKSKEASGSDYNSPMYKEPIRISNDYGKTWQTTEYKTDKQGQFTVPFNEAGVYYISAGPVFKNQPYKKMQCITPPICVVEVKPAPVTELTAGTVKAQEGGESSSSGGVSVSWKASPGAEGYEVSYTKAGGVASMLTTSETSIVLTDADPEGCDIKVVPYVTDKYVAMGEEYKTLRGKAAAVAYDLAAEAEAAARRELEQARADGKAVLEQYKKAADYRAAEQEKLADIVAAGKAAIDTAETKEAVEILIGEYKSKMDAVKTDAQYKAEEDEAARKEQEEKQKEEEEKRKAEEEARKKEEEKRKTEEEAKQKEEEEKRKAEEEARKKQENEQREANRKTSSIIKQMAQAVRSTVRTVNRTIMNITRAVKGYLKRIGRWN